MEIFIHYNKQRIHYNKQRIDLYLLYKAGLMETLDLICATEAVKKRWPIWFNSEFRH